MRSMLTRAVVIGALAAVPLTAYAATGVKPAAKQASAQSAKATARSSSARMATHSTRGVVKSMDANTLVVTRSGKKGGDVTFTLTPATQKEGDLAVGSRVSVRYHDQNGSHVVTAVTARHTMAAKAPKGSASKPSSGR